MAFKVIVFAAFIAAASAGAIGYPAPLGVASYAPVAPALSYSSISTPLVSRVAAPLSYAQAAPVVAKVASPLVYSAPAYTQAIAAPVTKTIIAEPQAPAHYDFGYSVNDPHTGDSKTQQESRNGDVVQGSYSLVEADGTRRIVEYVADAVNGFNAVVRREPVAVAVKAVAPVAYAAPVAKIAGPALVTKYAAAPAISYASPAAYYH